MIQPLYSPYYSAAACFFATPVKNLQIEPDCTLICPEVNTILLRNKLKRSPVCSAFVNLPVRKQSKDYLRERCPLGIHEKAKSAIAILAVRGRYETDNR